MGQRQIHFARKKKKERKLTRNLMYVSLPSIPSRPIEARRVTFFFHCAGHSTRTRGLRGPRAAHSWTRELLGLSATCSGTRGSVGTSAACSGTRALLGPPAAHSWAALSSSLTARSRTKKKKEKEKINNDACTRRVEYSPSKNLIALAPRSGS